MVRAASWAVGVAAAALAAAVMPVAANPVQDVHVSFLLPMSYVKGSGDCAAPDYLYDDEEPARCMLGGNSFRLVSASGMLGVEAFNARDGTYIPALAELGGCDKRIKATLYDTALSPSVAIKNVLNMLGESQPPDIIVGPAASSASVPTALITGVMDIPQLTWWSTSTQLDNVNNAPRFMRTIPSDGATAFFVCRYWKQEGYRFASMIYLNENYGEAYKEGLVRECTSLGIKVHTFPFSVATAESESTIPTQVAAMSETGTRVFLIVTNKDGYVEIVNEAHRLGIAGAGTSWMVSDGITFDDINSLSDEVKATVTGTLRIVAAGGTSNNDNFNRFVTGWSGFNASMINDYFPPHWSVDSTFFTDTTAMDSMVKDVGTFFYDTIGMIGKMVCEIAPTGPLPAGFGTTFWNLKESANITGLTGPVAFDEIGNRASRTATFEISNFAFDDSNQVYATKIGTFDTSTQLWAFSSSIVYNGNSAAKVPDMVIPEQDFRRALTVPQVCYVLWAVNVAFAIFCMSWTYMNRKHTVVRASQTKFLGMIAFGTMLSSGAILPLTVDDSNADPALFDETSDVSLNGTYSPANVACQLAVFLYSMGFVVTYSSLACKIYRVKRIFGNKSLKRVTISTSQLLTVMAACMAVDFIIIGSWEFSSPLKFYRTILSRDNYGNPLVSTGQCNSEYSTTFVCLVAAYHLSLLIYGSKLSYDCRNVDVAFSESRYISVAMVSNLQVLALAVPVLIIVADNPSSTMFLRSGVLFLNDLSVLCLIFVPKMILTRSTDPNTKVSSLNPTVGYTQQQTTATHEPTR